MAWNWQHPDWPRFRWRPGRLAEAEERFLVGGGRLQGAVEYLPEPDRHRITVELLSEEALRTSEIEGEMLDRASVQSSVQRALGLAADPTGPSPAPAEDGVAHMLVDVFASLDRPLDAARLGRWHAMIMRGRRDLRVVGGWRTHPEPMRIVSGRLDQPTVHFVAPASDQVPAEMEAFLDWFERTAPGGSEPLPAITRSGLAHLQFESVHPFEDGNGRIGRAVSEQALARSLGAAAPTGLAPTILRHRPAYYEKLERSVRGLDADAWLAWFAGIVLEAQHRSHATVAFVIDVSRLMDRLRDQVNERQVKALRRMQLAGPDGFVGGMSAGKYVRLVRTSPATARRDLGDLVDLGALVRTGERRHTRYHLSIDLRPTPRFAVAEDGRVIEAELPAPG